MTITQARPWRRKEKEPRLPKVVLRARRKFLKFFPDGFQDQTYLDWERNYKWEAHEAWDERLSDELFQARLVQGDFAGIAADAVRIESRTNLLFSFEKMALRDAVRSPEGARQFSEGLYQWLYGEGEDRSRFEQWVCTVGELPRVQTRVLTWPLLTVFGFVARPYVHMFLKPAVTRRAAFEMGFELEYSTRPDWRTYASLLDFAREVKRDTRDLGPRDMIDVQSFIWVQGSEEYD
jgi:hypothetical protein